MKLEKWTLLVESIGTIAIIVSLLFVAFEIRENTNATYAASYDTLAVSHIDWRMRIAANPQMREDWGSFLSSRIDPGALESEFNTIGYVLEALLLNYERAYFARQYGRLGDREWARYQASMCGIGALLAYAQETSYTKEFWQYLEDCHVEP